jgi:hypothetical protein
MIRLLPVVVLLALAAPAQAAFDPVAFFKGKSHGQGELKIIFQSPKTISVDSEGKTEPDGTLVLSQKVQEEGKPPRLRSWRLRRTSPTHFEGTLTDAAGPVSVDLIGGKARIRYTMKNHMSVEQWLTETAPGTVANQMKVRRFGVIVAHFNETIRKLD